MELGLSLGDASKPFNFLKNNPLKQQKNTRMKNGGLDFCMALGLNSIENEEREKAQKPLEDEDEDDDDDGDDEVSEEDGSEENPLQLNLLPFPPRISHHLHSFPWSSDNGSSENGSSAAAAAKGRGAAAAEEASSANSEMEYLCSGSKREMGNDVVEEEDDIDDDNGVNNSNRKKLRLSKQQSAFLEQTFKLHNTLNPKQKLGLAKQLNLRPRQVEVWFQNRRARTKSKQTEVDCEYLKRCCETLTEENRRLHKELQDLRALKTSNPFYMQLPATTLTMCPSCQRVATATTAAAVPATVPFPLNRPRFFPFLQTPTHHDQPAAT